MTSRKKNIISNLSREKQDFLFGEIELHVQLEEDLQKQNVGKMFVKAMSAVSELKSNEKTLAKMYIDMYEEFNNLLQSKISVEESILRNEESLNEVLSEALSDYAELTEKAKHNLEVYQASQQFFNEEIEALRLAKHSELARQIGSKKYETVRKAAYNYLKPFYKENPKISIGSLADILESDNLANPENYGGSIISRSSRRRYAKSVIEHGSQ